MKWIELIMVRSTDSRRTPTVRALVEQLQRELPEGITAVNLFKNAFVENDIVVHLAWTGARPARSDIGLELAATLEDFGRVHHTIWIEDKDPAQRGADTER